MSNKLTRKAMSFLAVTLAIHLLGLTMSEQKVGVFDGSCLVGSVLLPGNVLYQKANDSYTVSAAGENMWFSNDAFFFIWKKVKGNQAIESTISFLGAGKNAHRKACLMVRQSLDSDSAYADVAVHGDGLTSLQYRSTKGGTTHEVQLNVKAPKTVKLTRQGKYVLADVNDSYSGASIRLDMEGDYYIGMGVCSHDADVLETAVFKNVSVTSFELGAVSLTSTLETVDIASTDRRVVHVFEDHIEAPNWTPDGQHLVYNSGGLLYKMPWIGGRFETIDTAFADRCNNDHGISPDGKTIVISDQSQGNNQSTIYTLPFSGGNPTRITEGTPSYWHGWSPDGKTLTYCAQRDGRYGIFTIPATGGMESRLTTAADGGLDDGPDFSPDGKHIIFNSDRSGKMQIYQMNTDGSNLTQLTKDDRNNWFGHISPDGKWMAYLSYEPDVKGHPANKDVELRLLNLKNGSAKELAKLFGGQGTINVPSWSPDSKRVAFVSYQFVG
jgi:WD40 repeat protein